MTHQTYEEISIDDPRFQAVVLPAIRAGKAQFKWDDTDVWLPVCQRKIDAYPNVMFRVPVEPEWFYAIYWKNAYPSFYRFLSACQSYEGDASYLFTMKQSQQVDPKDWLVVHRKGDKEWKE